MKETKTVFRIYTIFQCRQEEVFLTSMSEKGWRLTYITFPGFYHFEKCEPGHVTYRIDFNTEGLRNSSEYVRMFSDCGWEHVLDFFGFSYFRKEGDPGNVEEIFCDDASRFDMTKRIFRGKIIPLIIIFAGNLLPQTLLRTVGSKSRIPAGLIYALLVLTVIYVSAFTVTAVTFCKAEKQLKKSGPGFVAKYILLFGLIAAMFFLIGFMFVNYITSA